MSMALPTTSTALAVRLKMDWMALLIDPQMDALCGLLMVVAPIGYTEGYPPCPEDTCKRETGGSNECISGVGGVGLICVTSNTETLHPRQL